MNSSHTHNARFWYLLGVLFKISEDHPRHFYIETLRFTNVSATIFPRFPRHKSVCNDGLFGSQFTGQTNVVYYASTIFQALGFQSRENATLASLGIGAAKVMF